MQNGSLRRAPRRRGPDVWAFRWREPGCDGRRVHRRIVIGTIEKFKNESAVAKAIIALRQEIKGHDCPWRKRLLTLRHLVRHYKQRELGQSRFDSCRPRRAPPSPGNTPEYRRPGGSWCVPCRVEPAAPVRAFLYGSRGSSSLPCLCAVPDDLHF